MIIHRRQEGEAPKLGINWNVSENTILGIYIVLPIYLIRPAQYEGFDTACQYYGWRVRVISFRLRLRRWRNFETKVKKICCGYSIYVSTVGKQELVSTKEMREDIKFVIQK